MSMPNPPFSSPDFDSCVQHAYTLVQFGRVAILLVGAWVREALKRSLVLRRRSAVYRIYYRYYCYPHFHGIYFYAMWLVLTSVCCDSNILFFTQKTRVPASTSAEICMCIGTHEFLCTGYGLRAMRISDAQQLVDFLLFTGENLVGSLILGVKNNPRRYDV